MKNLIPVGLIAAVAIAVPAYATATGTHGKNHPKHTNTHSGHCKHSTLTKSYVFGGKLTGNPGLTQTAGQSTPNTTTDDLYTVGLSLTVTHANKYAKPDHAKGSTFSTTLNSVAVKFGQNADNSQRTPQGGDHVTIHGRRAFKVKRNCTANASAPVGGVTYKSVGFGGQPQP